MELIAPEAILETERLALEPLQASHAPLLYPLLQAPEIYTYIPEEPPVSLEALTKRYQKLAQRSSPDRQQLWLNWALRLRTRGQYLGYLQATIDTSGTAEIAYVLAPIFWHHGYAREGCQRLLKLLCEDYVVQTVAACIDTRNTASQQLVEKLGLQKVATQCNADEFKGSVSHEYRYEYSSSRVITR